MPCRNHQRFGVLTSEHARFGHIRRGLARLLAAQYIEVAAPWDAKVTGDRFLSIVATVATTSVSTGLPMTRTGGAVTGTTGRADELVFGGAAIPTNSLRGLRVQLLDLSDFLARPQAILDAQLRQIDPAARPVAALPEMRSLDGLEDMLRRLRNAGLRPRLSGPLPAMPAFPEAPARTGTI